MKMSVLSKAYFHDEAAAFQFLESVLWTDGPVCPHCGTVDKAGKLEGVRSKASKKHPEGVTRHGLWKCYACRQQFTVKVGTVFESGHIPLHKMLQAVYLLTSSKKGISAHQLHRTLEITYKSAWFLAHRIREAFITGGLPPMGGSGKVVEVDETFIGRRPGREKKAGNAHKMAVLTLVERGGSARSFQIDRATIDTVKPIMHENILRDSKLMTDMAGQYRKMETGFADHEMVNHQEKEYVRGNVHTNTIEGFFSIFKRGMKGVYQHCSEKHLHRYLAEFDFRYSNRQALEISDRVRAEIALKGISGKRLKYGGTTPQ
jgi:transposase-like protein